MAAKRNIFRWFQDQFSFTSKINFKVVVLCMIGAATFWLFNALNKSYTSDIRIPLNFQYNTEDNVVFGRLPGNVVVNVSGGGWDLLRKSNLFSLQPLEIPLADPAQQKRIAGASLQPYVNTYLDGQLALNYIVTDSLYLDIDEKIARTLKIDIDSAGIRLAENYVLSTPVSLGRDSIRVTGARRYLDTLSSPLVISLPESEIDENYDERIGIYLDDFDNIDCEPNNVRVVFNVESLIVINTQSTYELVNFPESNLLHMSDSTVSLDVKLRSQYRDSTDFDFDVLVDYNLIYWEDSTVLPNVKNVPDYIQSVTVTSPPIKLVINDD